MSLSIARTPEQPFAQKKFLDVNGHRMAYIDEGEGPAVVFQHGSPTSSYLWRNVMPACAGLGRLVACDLMGFGDSDKLDPALGRYRYGYAEQRKHLFALWEELGLGDDVVLVLHDIGSIYGFDWANQHRERVQGIVYMESLVAPLLLSDFPEPFRTLLASRADPVERHEGPAPGLDFIDHFLLTSREFSETEQAYYRKPFLIPGEDRRPYVGTQFSVEGVPADTTKVMGDYASWLSKSDVPKLLIDADPGFILKGRLLEFARQWSNQTEVTVKGTHFVQETSPHEVGAAIATFVSDLRGASVAPRNRRSPARGHSLDSH